MRKSWIRLIAATLICSVLISGMVFSADATRDVDLVGAPGETIADGFDASDLEQITRLIRKEFNRTNQLRSEMYHGTRYFDYGEPTGDLVHASAFSMVQDFGGGYSTCLQAFNQPAQWCCIIVTPDSLEKGEAYTVRDAMATQFAATGSAHSSWGLPTGNQYWVVEGEKEILYQQFENGYARAENGSSLHMMFDFYHVWDDDYDPDFPKEGSEERPSFLEVLADGVPQVIEEIPGSPEFQIPTPIIDDTKDTSSVSSNDDPLAEEVIGVESEASAVDTTENTVSTTVSVVENDGSDGIENTGTTTSMMTRIVRKNSPFLDFLLSYWILLAAGGVILAGAAVALVLTNRLRKSKNGSEQQP